MRGNVNCITPTDSSVCFVAKMLNQDGLHDINQQHFSQERPRQDKLKHEPALAGHFSEHTCRWTVHSFLPRLLLPLPESLSLVEGLLLCIGGGGLGMTMVRRARAMSMLPL